MAFAILSVDSGGAAVGVSWVLTGSVHFRTSLSKNRAERELSLRCWRLRVVDAVRTDQAVSFPDRGSGQRMSQMGRKGKFAAFGCSHSAGGVSVAPMAIPCSFSTRRSTGRRRLPASSFGVDRSLALATAGRQRGSYRQPPTFICPDRTAADSLKPPHGWRSRKAAHGRLPPQSKLSPRSIQHPTADLHFA